MDLDVIWHAFEPIYLILISSRPINIQGTESRIDDFVVKKKKKKKKTQRKKERKKKERKKSYVDLKVDIYRSLKKKQKTNWCDDRHSQIL